MSSRHSRSWIFDERELGPVATAALFSTDIVDS